MFIKLTLITAAILGIGMLTGAGSAKANTVLALTTVTGTVTDGSSGHPVPNAEVTFTSVSGKIATRSGADGRFSITLPAGMYHLAIQAKGFSSATREAFTVSDQPIVIQIALSASGNLKTIANVSVGTQSAINVTPASINSVTSQQIAAQGSIGLSRVLSEIPGVQITMADAGATGGGNSWGHEYAVNSPANPVYVGLRGSQPYENATLFDGHRINSANWLGASGAPGGATGAFNLAMLDTQSVSSLNVIKGPGADSPTINNAIGGVVDIDPGVPSGPSSGTLSYGFDGSGGLQLNVNAQAMTKNKRLGLSISAGSNAVEGPIGGFPVFNVTSLYGCSGILNGTSIIDACNSFGSTQFSVPHINGSFYHIFTSAIACCEAGINRDTTLEQQRAVSLLYNVAPRVQLVLRYALNNSLSDYNCVPSAETFIPPPGYVGRYSSNYQFFDEPGQGNPSHELDQLYEWGLRTQIGKGTLRVSYLSYLSTNASKQHGYNGDVVCSNCTLSGEALVGGTFDPSTFCVIGSSLLTFNDQKVNLSQGFLGTVNIYTETLTHDIIAEAIYPIGNSTTAGLSYNTTVVANDGMYGCSAEFSPILGLEGTTIPSAWYHAGDFERLSSLHGMIHTMLFPNLQGQLSLYANQYQYHLTNPGDAIQRNFINSYSYFTAPRFGFEWRPRADIAIRASAGAGIAPIDISDLIGTNQPPQPNTTPAAYYTEYLANPNLKPESSFGEDLGTSIRLRDHVSSISFDVYSTTLRGEFFCNYELAGTYRGLPLFATQQRNLAHSKYEGLELTFEHRPATGFFWTLQGSLQRGFAYDIPANFYTSSQGPFSTNLTIVANSNFDGGMIGIGRVAYAQGFATFGYQNIRGYEASANLTYYGNNNGFYRPPFITIDLDGTLPLTNRLSLNVALANLTNIYPDLFYQPGQYAIIPYAHVDPSNNVGQMNTVQSVGPRHLSATMNFRF